MFVLTLAQPACLRAADPAGGTVDPSTVNRRFLFNEQPGSDNTTDVYTTDVANRLAVDASGNVTLACTTTRPAYSSEGGLYSYDTPIAFVKFDASGTVLWRNYSTSGNIPSLGNADFNLIQSFRGLADGWTVAVVTNGGAGSVQGIATVIRLDASGGVVFASAYGIGDSFANNFRSTPVSISPDAAGNVYVAGVHAKGASNYYTNDGVSQQLVLRYDANPALVWSILGPNEADTSRSVSGPVSLAGLRLGAGGIPSVATANTSSRATPRSPTGARNRPRRWRWACTSPTARTSLSRPWRTTRAFRRWRSIWTRATRSHPGGR